MDSANDTGWHTSIALDAVGEPQISYYDRTNLHLKYARWNDSSWQVQVVDGSKFVGTTPSMALDDEGYPHISYDIGEIDNGYNHSLQYVWWNGTAWQGQEVDNNGYDSSLALDQSGKPHISYTSNGLKYAWWDGSNWQFQMVDSVGYGGPSLALDTAGYPHIAYYDSTNRGLSSARWDGSTWQLQLIDTSVSFGYSQISLSLDTTGRPHIGYSVGNTPQVVKYARWDGAAWQVQEVLVGTYQLDGARYFGAASFKFL